MHHTDKYSQHSSIIWPVRLNGWAFGYELSGYGFESRYSHLNLDIKPVLSSEFLDIQANTKYRFTLKLVCDMMRTHNHWYWKFVLVLVYCSSSFVRFIWIKVNPSISSICFVYIYTWKVFRHWKQNIWNLKFRTDTTTIFGQTNRMLKFTIS